MINNGLADDDGHGGQVTPVILLNSEVYVEVWNDFQKLADLTQCPNEFDNELTEDWT